MTTTLILKSTAPGVAINNGKSLTIPELTSTHLQITQNEDFDVHHSLLLPPLVHLIVDEAAKSASLVLHICKHKQKNWPSFRKAWD
jgi:hypothetical protein